jgi:EAL domain-containing protein (putative c-di-GMP-specific phosphodiesterase class I)
LLAQRSAATLCAVVTPPALEHAFENGELGIDYQPVVALATGSMVGAEALLRWDQRDDHVGLPIDLLSVAEEGGLTIRIGAWVIGEACRSLVDWQRIEPSMWVSVNVSARQLAAPDTTTAISEAVQPVSTRGDGLHLEMTEEVLNDPDTALPRRLANLKALGVDLVIDDFGAGYSQLGTLRRFPFDALKIGRSLVDGRRTEAEGMAVISAVAALTSALGLTLAAQDVESGEQLGRLREIGCRRAQGPLLAPPMSSAGIAELLTRRYRWWRE